VWFERAIARHPSNRIRDRCLPASSEILRDRRSWGSLEERTLGRRKRGWNAAASLSLDDLRRLCEEKEAKLGRLMERREALAAELQQLDAELGGSGSGRGRAAGRRRRGGRGRRRGPGRPPKATKGRRGGRRKRGARGPRGEGGLQNMIRKALASSSEPMKLADLAQAVLDAGYQTSSSRFGVIVGQRLSEMKDVKKAGRGLYTVRK
jgi:hypothetical protein